jgi:hypothetical protein
MSARGRVAIVGFVGLMGLFAGCAPAAPASAPPSGAQVDGHLVLRGLGATPTVAKLEGVRFYGPDGDVERFEDGWRGRWRGEVVDLRVSDGDRITGVVHGGIADLHVVRENDHDRLQGIFGGDLGSLRMDAREIDGTIGRRGLHVVRRDGPGAAGSVYTGVAGSGGAIRAASPVPVVDVELPAGFDGLPLVERAVWVALLIGA